VHNRNKSNSGSSYRNDNHYVDNAKAADFS